jgi:hypothetical protein
MNVELSKLNAKQTSYRLDSLCDNFEALSLAGEL